MSDKPVLDYASPEPTATSGVCRQPRRRSGLMGIFLGMSWVPSELAYDPTPRGRIFSLLTFVTTLVVILLVHGEFTRRRTRFAK